MRTILTLHSSSNVTTPLPVLSTASHVTFVNGHSQHRLAKFNVNENDEIRPSTSLDALVYNTSTNNDNDSSEFATIAIKELISKHFKLSTGIPDATQSTFSTVPNVTDSDSYLAVRNISSLPCINHNIPSVNEYLAAINIAGVTIFTLGVLAVLVILYMYVDTMKHIMKYAPALVKTHSAFVLSVYPVVAIATYCAIVVPRAHLLAEAMTQGMFMAALYQLFCLFVAYCGGEAELIKRVKPNSLVLRVPPCCCWPCCFCLPLLPVNKTNMKRLRLLVLQLPVVQGLVYMVLLVMWAEEESLYQVNYVYMQPLIILSILCGIWGIIMTMTMLEEVLKEHNIRGKFFVLQLVLLLAKLQGLVARFAVWRSWFPCKMPITPTVYANLIYNSSMLWEMIVLMYIARKLYKQPVTDLSNTKSHTPVHICPVIPCTHETYSEKNNNQTITRY